MKKILFVVLATFSLNGYAQFQYSNQWALSVSGGVTTDLGYNIGIGFDRAFGLSMHGLQGRLLYFGLNAKTDKGTFKFDRYALHLNYLLSLDKIIQSKFFFINLAAGGVFGFDNLPKQVKENIYVNNESGIIAGLNMAIQCEFKITRGFHIYIEPRVSYLFVSKIRNYDCAVNGGVKIYL